MAPLHNSSPGEGCFDHTCVLIAVAPYIRVKCLRFKAKAAQRFRGIYQLS